MTDDERILCSIHEVRARMRALAMSQFEHSDWSLILAAVSDIKEEYDILIQRWPWSRLPYRDDLVTAAAVVSPVTTAANLDDEIEAGRLGQVDLRAGWRAVAQQFEHVLALGDHGSASSGAMAHSINDCGWVGRLFFAHDHCLLIGARLDGRHPRESTLVCISRGGHAVPPHAHSAVEICLETLAMKLSEVRWRRHAGERCAFVCLSAPNVALCIGAPAFPAMVSSSEELTGCASDEAGRRNDDTSGSRDKSALVIQTTSAGAGTLRVRLRALAPWRTLPAKNGNPSDNALVALGRIEEAGPKTELGYPVEITASPGLCVTPHRATLPVTVTLSLANNGSLPTIHSGDSCNGRKQLLLTVAGRDVVTMRREIKIF